NSSSLSKQFTKPKSWYVRIVNNRSPLQQPIALGSCNKRDRKRLSNGGDQTSFFLATFLLCSCECVSEASVCVNWRGGAFLDVPRKPRKKRPNTLLSFGLFSKNMSHSKKQRVVETQPELKDVQGLYAGEVDFSAGIFKPWPVE